MKVALSSFCALAALSVAGVLHHRHGNPIEEVNAASFQEGPPVPRAHYGRRLEPAGNTVLHGAGQTDWASFAAYRDAVAPARPVIFMTYVDLRDDLPAFFNGLHDTLRNEPAIQPQIGLSLNRGDSSTHYEAETAAGKDDPALDNLCAGLNSLNRSVFLRPGYEFNGSWNGYLPTGYVAAFRRIAARVHSCAPRTAVIWDWSADAEVDAEAGGSDAPAASRWQPYYPGDDAVDWWALNLFTVASLRSVATHQFLHAAAQSRHPVMIAESTPKGYNVQTSRAVWSDWFAPYFGLIHTYPGIRAFCYINWNWAGFPQWADWGNARIEDAPPKLQQRLRDELERPLYAAPKIRSQVAPALGRE